MTARAAGAADVEAAVRVEELGARDVLVFRRLARGTWAHVGGVGLGSGWAGIVEADEATEPMLRQVLASAAAVRVLAGTPARVVGPYYAGTAVLLRLREDLVAVWGHPARSQRLMAAPEAELLATSLELVEATGEAGHAQGLGDELEVLHVVQRLTGVLGQSLPVTLEQVAAVAAEALSCELVAVWVDGGAYAVAQQGPGAPAAHEVADVLGRLLDGEHAGGVRQDSRTAPLPSPLAPEDGVVSHLLLPFAPAVGGGLLAVHLDSSPRGFTSLCRRIAAQLVDAASVLLQVAQARDTLEDQLHSIQAKLGRDALTSAASRHRWEDELERAQELVDQGIPVTVALVDLDDLKLVNDTYGHRAGDVLLRVCASALGRSLREGTDVVARVGGDEFAVLALRAADAQGLANRLRSGLEGLTTPDGLHVRASVGAAACRPGERITDAVAAADAAMYQDKRERRQPRTSR